MGTLSRERSERDASRIVALDDEEVSRQSLPRPILVLPPHSLWIYLLNRRR